MNTMFCKTDKHHLAYRENKRHGGGPPCARQNYEKLNYALTPTRGRNAFRVVANDRQAGLNTDHYRLVAPDLCSVEGEIRNKQKDVGIDFKMSWSILRLFWPRGLAKSCN